MSLSLGHRLNMLAMGWFQKWREAELPSLLLLVTDFFEAIISKNVILADNLMKVCCHSILSLGVVLNRSLVKSVLK